MEVIKDLQLEINSLIKIATDHINTVNDENCEVLTVREENKCNKRSSDGKSSEYAPIPKKITKKHPFTGRIGQRADMMRQWYRAKMSLAEFIKYPANSHASGTKTCKESLKKDGVPLDVLEEIEIDSTKEIEKTHLVHIQQGVEGQEANLVEVEHVKTVECAGSPRRRVIMEVVTERHFNEVSNNRMLTHSTINIAQNIMHAQSDFPGLEDTGLNPEQFSNYRICRCISRSHV